jgi:hypothetical protein
MQENHSYGSYLGLLDHGEGLQLDQHGHPVASNPSAAGTPITLKHFKGTVQKKDVPTQSWNASHIQCDAGDCTGFTKSLPR